MRQKRARFCPEAAVHSNRVSVFLAIELPPALRAPVAEQIERHRPQVTASWQRPEKLHVTLVFLGNPTPEVWAEHVERARPIVAATKPFSLHLSGAGTFVTQRAPSVLWLGLGGQLEALNELQRSLASALSSEPRPYVPHLTLGRSQQDGAYEQIATSLQDFRTDSFRVTRLELIESTHHQYRPLVTLPLRENPA